MARLPLAIHTVCNPQVGRGHMSRCLALAEAMRALGWHPIFLLHAGQQGSAPARQAGFEVIERPRWSDDDLRECLGQLETTWVILDHHAVRRATLEGLRQSGIRSVGLSVVGEGAPYHDVLINPLAASLPWPVPQTRMCGVDAAFVDRARLLAQPLEPVDILLTLGASALGQAATPALAAALAKAFGDRTIAVTHLPPRLAHTGLQAVRDDSHFLSLLAGCAVVVCSFGMTVFEAGFLGRAVVTVALTEQHMAQAQTLESWEMFDLHHVQDRPGMVRSVGRLLGDARLRERRCESARQHIDGYALERVAGALHGILRA